MIYEVVIGVEVHAQLRTKSKMFCGCPTLFGAPPNSHTCPVCLGLPGSLPVINRTAVEMAVRAGLALNCTIGVNNRFARKNYFYPDLPKGYQISQYESPICEHGWIDIASGAGGKRVRIRRAHLEEDAGKNVHQAGANGSVVDLNRAGTPLLEIVTEPDMRSSDEVVAYLKGLRDILMYLDVCDGNMEEGSFRCEPNLSLRPTGQQAFGTKVELKNINSFKYVKDAMEYEIKRQTKVLSEGGKIKQETRLWNIERGETAVMRSKEEAHDYRYFPDPDLLPLEFDDAYVEALKIGLPELPDEKKQRFIGAFGLSPYDAGVLVAERETADFFEAVAKGRDGKVAANWVINELFGRLNKEGKGIEDTPVSAAQLGGIIDLIAKGDISGKIAKDLFEIIYTEGGDPAGIVEARGMKQVTDTGAIEAAVDAVLAENPDKAAQAKEKPSMAGWFVGQVMKATGGKANPQTVQKMIREKLGIG